MVVPARNLSKSKMYILRLFLNLLLHRKKKKKSDADNEEPSSVFQRVRVDYLLKILTDKFPPPQIKRAPHVVPTPATSAGASGINPDSKANLDVDVKSEKGESIKSEKVDDVSARGIKREAPSSSGGRPSSATDQSKKMKFS